MNREEYLQQFKKNLIHISDAEKEDAVRYYAEYFDDAGAENEQRIIEELGSPVMLARKISAEAAIKEIDGSNEERNSGSLTAETGTGGLLKKKRNGIGGNLFVIILLLCSFPIWLPLAIAASVVVFMVILIAFILVFCAVVIGAAFALAGIVGFLAGFVSLFTHFINGITVIGAGMVMAGFGVILFIAGKYLVKGIIALLVALGKRKTSRM